MMTSCCVLRKMHESSDFAVCVVQCCRSVVAVVAVVAFCHSPGCHRLLHLSSGVARVVAAWALLVPRGGQLSPWESEL